ncbi:hypothetical protein ABZ805_27380 [Saccharopolyspora sp. NPDC047091]|uniref:hypothetical protein n=1 Tax=Saccharopolyspora sp. NPDC047091 TaxID=3155924 RepID=UPI0033C56563
MSEAKWEITAAGRAEAIVITMAVRGIHLTQGETRVEVVKEQLGELSDKLYFLDMAFQGDAETAVEVLCAR